VGCIIKACRHDDKGQLALDSDNEPVTILTNLSRLLGENMKTYSLRVIFLTCLLSGCSGADYTYVDTNEEKPGPGLFSGDDGVFTVIKKSPEEVVKEQDSAEKASSE